MLLGALGARLLGNMVSGKRIIRAGYSSNGYQSKIFNLRIFNLKKESCLWMKRTLNQGFLIPPHPLTKFEIQQHYQNEPRFNGVYSRDNLRNKIKDEAHITNLDEYSDIGLLCTIALLCMP